METRDVAARPVARGLGYWCAVVLLLLCAVPVVLSLFGRYGLVLVLLPIVVLGSKILRGSGRRPPPDAF